MKEIVEKDYDIIAIKKMVVDQLTHSKDFDLHYKVRIDFLNNYKTEKNYGKMMESRTGVSAVNLYKDASIFIKSINSYIFSSIKAMSPEKRANLLNETKDMDLFLGRVKEEIKSEVGESDMFLQKRG